MATRAGKAFVDFEGRFDKLQTEAGHVVHNIAGSVGRAFTSSVKSAVNIASASTALLSGATIGYIGKATLAAGRVQELNVTLEALAKANHVSLQTVLSTADAVKKQGIETAVAQGITAQFVESHLDLAKASNLARLSQDAAVISGKNSTDTLAGIMEGIQTMQTDVLRNNGVFINGQDAINKYAKAHHIAANAMSATQKQAAYLDAVLASGVNISGAYAAAMELPGKQLRSFPRLFNDIAVSIGTSFLPAFGGIVTPVYKAVKAFDDVLQKGGPLTDFFNRIGKMLGDAVKPLSVWSDKFVHWIQTVDMTGLNSLLSTLQNFAPVVVPLVSMFTTLGATKLPFIGDMLPAINPLIIGFGALIAMSPDLRNAFGEILQTVMPIFQQIGGQLATMLQNIMPVISTLVTSLSPLIGDFAKVFGSALTQILPIIQNLLVAFTPIIQTLGQSFLKILIALTPVLVTLLQALTPIIDAFAGAFADALVAIMPSLTQLITIIGNTLTQVLVILTPVLQQLAPLIGDLLVAAVTAFAPVLEALAPIAVQLAQVLVQVIQALLPILPAITQLIPPLAQLMLAVMPLVTMFVNILAPILIKIAQFLGLVAQVMAAEFTAELNVAKPIVEAFIAVLQKIGDTISAIIGAFQWVAGQLTPVLAAVFDPIKEFAGKLVAPIQVAIDSIKTILTTTFGWIADRVRDAKNALASIGIGSAQVGGATGKAIDDLKKTLVNPTGGGVGAAEGATIKPRAGGTLVIAGEAGQEEDFVPADKRQAYARGILRGQLATVTNNYHLTVDAIESKIDEQRMITLLERMRVFA